MIRVTVVLSAFLMGSTRRERMLPPPTMKLPKLAVLATGLSTLLFSGLAFGQDPFEIQVYEYETVPKRMWNLETHLNYVGRGTTEFEGLVAPTEHQFHLTF